MGYCTYHIKETNAENHTILYLKCVLVLENFEKMYILELIKFTSPLYGNRYISQNSIITMYTRVHITYNK